MRFAALDAGYRHIDTATLYGNEKPIGKALRESGIPGRVVRDHQVVGQRHPAGEDHGLMRAGRSSILAMLIFTLYIGP